MLLLMLPGEKKECHSQGTVQDDLCESQSYRGVMREAEIGS